MTKPEKQSEFFIAVNSERKEFLHPHAFGDGMTLMEIVGGSWGFLAGLAILMKRGAPDNGLVGAWANNRVQLVGDHGSESLYTSVRARGVKDISFDLMAAYKSRDLLDGGMLDGKHAETHLGQAMLRALDAKTRWRRTEGVGDLLCDEVDRERYKELFN